MNTGVERAIRAKKISTAKSDPDASLQEPSDLTSGCRSEIIQNRWISENQVPYEQTADSGAEGTNATQSTISRVFSIHHCAF